MRGGNPGTGPPIFSLLPEAEHPSPWTALLGEGQDFSSLALTFLGEPKGNFPRGQ